MRKATHFIMIQKDQADHLETAVNDFLKLGYELQGPTFTGDAESHFIFVQAMVKYSNPKKKVRK